MKVSIKKTQPLHWVVFLMIIYIGIVGNYYITATTNIFVIRAINVVILLFIGFNLKRLGRKSRVTRKQMQFFTALILFQTLSIMVNGLMFGNDISNFMALIVTFVTIASICESDYYELREKAVFFLCIFSLITFFGFMLLPQLFDTLPEYTNSNGIVYKFCLFSVVPTNMIGYYRNFGFCSEPGMFQVSINLSLYTELFLKDKAKLWRVTIYIITLITTFSTQGYIVGLLIILAYVNKNDLEDRKTRRSIFFLSLTIVIGILAIYMSGEMTNSYVFDKFKTMSTGGSAYERVVAAEMAIGEILSNPITGVGWVGHAATYLSGHILTFTILNWFAIYGIGYGLICTIGLFFTVYRRYYTIRTNVIMVLMIIALTSFQDLSSSIIILSMIFYRFGNGTQYPQIQS